MRLRFIQLNKQTPPIATPFYSDQSASLEKVLDTTHFQKKRNGLSSLEIRKLLTFHWQSSLLYRKRRNTRNAKNYRIFLRQFNSTFLLYCYPIF